jgi:hypothetical protein
MSICDLEGSPWKVTSMIIFLSWLTTSSILIPSAVVAAMVTACSRVQSVVGIERSFDLM